MLGFAFKANSAFAQVTPPISKRKSRRLSRFSSQAPATAQGTGPYFQNPRASFGHAKIGDDVYFVGGHTGGFHCYPSDRFTDDVLAFNIKTGAWRQLPKYPFPVQGLRLAATQDSLFAFGGYRYEPAFHFVGCNVDSNGLSEQMKDTFSARSDDQVFRFDVAAGQWEPFAQMPRRRSSNAIIAVGQRIYLVAGWDGTPPVRRGKGRFHASIDVLDLNDHKFVPYDSTLTFQTRRALASADWNGKMVLVGGLSETTPPSSIADVTVFDPTTGRFSEGAFPKLADQRFAPGACFTGKFLVVAGGLSMQNGLLDSIVFASAGSGWKTNAVKLERPAMFVELVPINETTVIAVGAYGEELPFPLLQTITIGTSAA